jgi:diguanylate cyclase (GGDEF)-like protein/PAS domain S-box-containing protein
MLGMLKNKQVSLKWKFTLVISSVLIFVHALLAYLVYIDSNKTFNQNREKSQQYYIHIARALVDKSAMVLEQIAETMLITEKLITENVEQSTINRKQQVIENFDYNWDKWQLTWGLDCAVFYDLDGQLLQQWGLPKKNARDRTYLVLQEEKPIHSIVCTDQCYSIVTVPVISSFELSGTLSIGRSLADSIIEYHNATDTDIGILTIKDNISSSQDFPYMLSAVTNSQLIHPVYKLIKQQYSFAELELQSHNIYYQSRIYNVKVHPVSDEIQQTAFFILIDDVTEQTDELFGYMIKVFVSGIISLLVTMLLLFLLINTYFKRIHHLSDMLPLLAKHQFQKVRQFLQAHRQPSFGYDEIDKLLSTTHQLTNQLEELERDVNENTNLLTKQSQELTTERDFINKLVEAAPIIILTQNHKGEIVTINQEGVNLLGGKEIEYKSSLFDSFITYMDLENKHNMELLRKGLLNTTLKFDADLQTPSGKTHPVSWLHSVIYNEVNSFHYILTIGLDISKRKAAEKEMRWWADHDHLTSLSNRRHFNTEFDKIIKQARRYKKQVALFYLDLDQFKIINDTQGHQQGDSLLKKVSDKLQSITRETDLLCRMGGDEFTILVPDSKFKGVVALAIKINKAMSSIALEGKDETYKVSTSVGIAVYPQHGLTRHELLRNADLAMYKAKETGFGKYHIFSNSEKYHARLTEKMKWKGRLEEAIRKDAFVLFYQPIMNLKNNTVSHYECLVRIVSDDQKIIMPGEFIEYAEEMGLIGEIDKIVLGKAVQKHLEFQQAGKDIKLAINLSARSLNDDKIRTEIKRLLTLPGVKADNIILELTETFAVSNFKSAQLLINEIKSLGCKFALDDFGVGFSSFTYLKNLPVDYIKIDGSFIRKIDKSREDQIFVKAISDISHDLGKQTIAEFVENDHIMSLLKDYNIDYAQGYHIGKPRRLI